MNQQKEDEINQLMEKHANDKKELKHSHEMMLQSLNENFDQQMAKKEQEHANAM